MDRLRENLKKLGEIKPDESYSQLSLQTILNSRLTKQPTSYFNFRLPLSSLTLRVGLLAVTLGVVIFSATQNSQPVKLTSLDISGMKAEAQELERQLKLAEISYKQESGKPIEIALKETAQNGPGQLNPLIISKEAKTPDIDTSNSELTDKALKELTR